MYRNTIKYKGENLAPNSEAAELHAAKKFPELNWLLKQTHQKWLKESGRDPKDWPQHPDIVKANDPSTRK